MKKEQNNIGFMTACKHFFLLVRKILLDTSLRKKMILLYVFAIFIPVLTLGCFYLNRTRSIVKSQSAEQMINELSLVSQRLDVMFSSVEEVSSMLAYDKELVSAVNKEYDSLVEARAAYDAVWNRYTNLQTNWPYLRNLSLYFDNASLVTVWPYLINIHDYMKDSSEYDRIMASGTAGCWSEIRKVAANREYWSPRTEGAEIEVFAYSRAISKSNRIYIPNEVLTLEVYASQLDQCLSMENSSFIVFLVNHDGKIIKSTEGYGQEYLDTVPLYMDLFSGEKKYAEYEVAETNTQIASYSKMDNGWKLFICMSLEAVMEPHQKILQIGLLFLLAATLVSLSIILLFSSSISNRVSQLIQKMEIFMDGSFQIGPLLEGKDEIGTLDRQFTNLAENLKTTIHEQYVLKLQRTKAELEVLQTQVNPHFLYNALSTINWLTEKGDMNVVHLAVESLAKFYQVNLSKGQDIIQLSQELECLKAYMEIQKLRYAGRIQIYYDLDEALSNIMIPKLTLQTLVENSIQHGMAGEKTGITILVSDCLEGDRVCITIQDDGLGMSEEQLEALQNGKVASARGNGIGFKNIHERIQMHFGEGYGLTIFAKEGKGTTVHVFLPVDFEPLD